MLDCSVIGWRGAERIPAEAGFSKFDHVFVAIGDCPIDQLVLGDLKRLDSFGHRARPAIAGIESASRLPSEAQCDARGRIVDVRSDIAERSVTGQAMNKVDSRRMLQAFAK